MSANRQWLTTCRLVLTKPGRNGGNTMGNTSCNLNEGNVIPVEVSHEPSARNARSKPSDVPARALSRSNWRSGKHPYSHSHASDDDLITAAQRGDHQAFVELCTRHSSIAKRRILRIVRNHADAEDALQDTLLRAYMHLTDFRRSCKFATWLTTIGVNSALMIMRKRRVRKETSATVGNPDSGTVEIQEPADQSLGPEEICVEQQAILLLRHEVEKLQPNLRSIVCHYYGSECSLKEAADALEITVAAAKTRLLRGRVRLRSSLGRYGISRSGN